MVARDIRLAEITGGRLHIQHISTARSVELVREGKRRGVRVTAEACPHHFTLTDERLRTFDSNYKMNPPLRTWSDVEAVIGGLKDGTIELLATDHAPHAPEKKMRELDQAPFGIVGLETLIPITVLGLIEPGHLTWPEVIRKLTINPAQLLGIPKGTLRAGADADVTIIDPDDPLDDRPDAVPLQEPQHPVRRLGGPRPGPHGDRRRRGPLHPRRDRPAGRRGRPGLTSDRADPSRTPDRVAMLESRDAIYIHQGDRDLGIRSGRPHALAHRRLQRDARGGPARAEARPRGVPQGAPPVPQRPGRRARPGRGAPDDRRLRRLGAARRLPARVDLSRGSAVLFAVDDEDADARIERPDRPRTRAPRR